MAYLKINDNEGTLKKSMRYGVFSLREAWFLPLLSIWYLMIELFNINMVEFIKHFLHD